MGAVPAAPPEVAMVDLVARPHELDNMRVLGYYVADDLVHCNVPDCGGLVMKLPDNREVTVTRQWCNVAPPFDRASMAEFCAFFVEERPPAHSFVADITHAYPVAYHVREEDVDGDELYQHRQRGWHAICFMDDDDPPLTTYQRMQLFLRNGPQSTALDDSDDESF